MQTGCDSAAKEGPTGPERRSEEVVIRKCGLSPATWEKFPGLGRPRADHTATPSSGQLLQSSVSLAFCPPLTHLPNYPQCHSLNILTSAYYLTKDFLLGKHFPNIIMKSAGKAEFALQEFVSKLYLVTCFHSDSKEPHPTVSPPTIPAHFL